LSAAAQLHRLRPWWLVLPASRRDEIRDVRRRLRAAGRRSWDEAAVERLKRARAAMTQAQGRLRACESCAIGCDPPHGQWEGGFCCGGETANLISDTELASMAACGIGPADLVPPTTREHAGCAFRGPRGCSLDASKRPCVCLWYLCRDVSQELGHAGRGKQAGARARELEQAFIAFAATLSPPSPRKTGPIRYTLRTQRTRASASSDHQGSAAK
jgi:hypothetical protein